MDPKSLFHDIKMIWKVIGIILIETRYPQDLRVNVKNLNLRKFFSQRVVDNWNSLPAKWANIVTISAKTVNQFYNNFDQYLKENGYGVLKGITLH